MATLISYESVTIETEKKGRYRPCRKTFLEPGVPPSPIHLSLARAAIRLHVCGMLVLSRVMCFQTAIPSMSISARSARRRWQMAKRTSHSDFPFVEWNSSMAIGARHNYLVLCPFCHFYILLNGSGMVLKRDSEVGAYE